MFDENSVGEREDNDVCYIYQKLKKMLTSSIDLDAQELIHKM